MSYLVVELPKSEKRKVQLKATLSGLSLEEFIKKSLNEPVEATPIHCSCGGETKIIKQPYYYEFTMVDLPKKIIILNTPQHECKSCGSIGLSDNTNHYLKKILENEINKSLKKLGRLPEIVDFNDLISL